MKALLCGKSFLFKRVSLKQWLLLNFWFAIKKLCNIITVFVISTAVSTYTHEDLLKTLNLDVAIPNPFSTVPSPHKSIVKQLDMLILKHYEKMVLKDYNVMGKLHPQRKLKDIFYKHC